MAVPRRLESEMAGAALEAVLSSRAASISDSSSVDEANEESLMIKLLQAGLVRCLLLWNQTSSSSSLFFHLPSTWQINLDTGHRHGQKTKPTTINPISNAVGIHII